MYAGGTQKGCGRADRGGGVMGTDEFSALDELKRFTDEGVRTHRKVYKRIAETTGMTIEQLSDGIYHANLRADVAQILQREAEALNRELMQVLENIRPFVEIGNQVSMVMRSKGMEPGYFENYTKYQKLLRNQKEDDKC